jgi:hypothetical protein
MAAGSGAAGGVPACAAARPGVFAPDLGPAYDGSDRRWLARDVLRLAAGAGEDVAAALRQLAGALTAAGTARVDCAAMPGDLRAQVGAALMGAVEADRLAGLGVAGPMLRLAAEWGTWVRHSPA